MSLISDALAARRDLLVAALYDYPELRAVLSTAQLTTIVDQALATVGLENLLDTVQKAEAVKVAVAANIATPPAEVATALGVYDAAAVVVNDYYGIFPS